MEEKKRWNDWVALTIKVFAGIALYFAVAILITATDKVIAADKVGSGYALFLVGSLFLSAQFAVTLKVTGEIFSGKVKQWIPLLIKALVGCSFFLSFAALAGFSESLIMPETTTGGFVLAVTGALMFILLFSLFLYGVADLMEKQNTKQAEE